MKTKHRPRGRAASVRKGRRLRTYIRYGLAFCALAALYLLLKALVPSLAELLAGLFSGFLERIGKGEEED